MKPSNGVPSLRNLPFSLGDSVLVRYSSFPYWPAIVARTHQQRFKRNYVAMLPTRKGEKVLCFWCNFANEDSGGWVRADRMLAFHPAVLHKIRVDRDSYWYGDQKKAIEFALSSFQAVHKNEEIEVPQLPADLKRVKHNGEWDATYDDDDIISDDESRPEELEDDGEDSMDLGNTDNEEEEDVPRSTRSAGRPMKGEKTLARPMANKEPRKALKRKSVAAEEPQLKKRSKPSSEHEQRMAEVVVNDSSEPRRKPMYRHVEEEIIDCSSGKRKLNSPSYAIEPSAKVRKLEAELASAKEKISSLKRSLKEKERKFAELTGDGAGVVCVIPPLPPSIEEPLPGQDKYRSVSANSKDFEEMIATLRDQYSSFEKAAGAADEARTEFEKSMEKIKKLYHEASEKLSTAEENATKKEREVVGILREILEADVEVDILRDSRAGRVVRGILKKCQEIPTIRNFCDAIYQSWKKQVVEYLKENKQKLKKESGGGRKSSQSEKTELQSLEIPQRRDHNGQGRRAKVKGKRENR